MSLARNHLFQLGDWVSGTSFKDERFHGFIENIDPHTGEVTIRMIQTDREEAVGQVTKSHLQRLNKLPFTPYQSTEQILDLIDIALTNKDKEWFLLLTEKLKQLQANKKDNKKISMPLPPRNRFNRSKTDY